MVPSLSFDHPTNATHSPNRLFHIFFEFSGSTPTTIISPLPLLPLQNTLSSTLPNRVDATVAVSYFDLLAALAACCLAYKTYRSKHPPSIAPSIRHVLWTSREVVNPII